MRAVYLLMLLAVAICALAWFGKDRAAYTVLRLGDHILEGEKEEDDHTAGKARNNARGTTARRAYLSPYLKKQIAYDQGWKCSCGCGASLQPDFHIDHTIPLWLGGGDTTDNMSAMNPQCHAKTTAIENQRA